MIPKTIHLCWFSGDPYPIIITKCINSWKKVVPDYRIKIWDKKMALELNIDFINQAIEKRKWAFAADVVRLYALYTEGGVYMDADFYLLKSFEPFFTNKFISFNEVSEGELIKEKINNNGDLLDKNDQLIGFGIQAAFMASEKNNPFVKKVFDYYKNINFFDVKEGKNNSSILAPQIYVKIAESFGFKYVDKRQDLDAGITIYESKYLMQTMYDKPKKNAFGIHCCSHSWYYSPEEEKRIEKKWKNKELFRKIFGYHFTKKMNWLFFKITGRRQNLLNSL